MNKTDREARPPAEAGGLLSLSKNPCFHAAKAGVLLQFGEK